MTKKSYNPFKMWGAWIGAVIGLLIIPLGFAIGTLGLGGSFFGGLFNVFTIWATVMASTPFVIGGFLIGWGIHSLVRAIRK